VPDRDPHPRAHTHGDEYEKDILDRVLTEVEGMRDDFVAELRGLRADLVAMISPPLPPSGPAPDPVPDEPAGDDGSPAGPVAIDITEPAVTPATPRKRAAKAAAPQPSKES
jgi:hypothetical protein